MTDKPLDEPLIVRQLREPLTEPTRKISRELLISSTVGLVVVYAGLVPTRINALGIELTPSNQAFFRYVIAGVVLYLTAVFLINVASEITAWGTLFNILDAEKFAELLNAANEAVVSARKSLEDLEPAREGVAESAEAKRKRLLETL